MKTCRVRRLPWILATCALIALAGAPLVEAGAARTRPSGRAASSGASRTTGASRTSSATRASGQATYGYTRGRSGHHGYHHGHGYGYYGHYGHYGYPWYPYWGGYYPAWGAYPGMTLRVPETAPAAIETDVRPKKAEVLIDGEFAGQARDFNGTWDLLWLDPGEHVVEFRAPGYKTLRQHVPIAAGGYVRLHWRLEKGEGLDARSTTAPPASAAPAAVAAAPEVETRLGTVRSGLLKLAVSPPDAAVYLDGEFLARADELARLHGALPVAQGEHTLEIVRPGYVGDSRRIVVEVGQPLRIEVALQRGER